jgi:hypothetical protein
MRIPVGLWNSGIGFASPVTVPDVRPDCSIGILGSWELTFSVISPTVTLTLVMFSAT